jgi:hypothetical protein
MDTQLIVTIGIVVLVLILAGAAVKLSQHSNPSKQLSRCL